MPLQRYRDAANSTGNFHRFPALQLLVDHLQRRTVTAKRLQVNDTAAPPGARQVPTATCNSVTSHISFKVFCVGCRQDSDRRAADLKQGQQFPFVRV